MNPETVTPAAVLMTPAEVRAQFKLTESAEDPLLTNYIAAGTRLCERWLRRAFVLRSYRLYLDTFQPADAMIPSPTADPTEILLPYPPLVDVTAVKYTDGDGNPQTFAAENYNVDTIREPGRIKPVPGSSWPGVQAGIFGAVRIEYDAGYATAAAVPEEYKQLVRWLVAMWYRNREPAAGVQLAPVPLTLQDWADSLKIHRVQ